MKRLIVIVSLFCGINQYSQESLTFQKDVISEGKSKSELYVILNEWFAITYTNANSVIQMQDKESGIIIGKGSMNYSMEGMSYACYSGYIKYTIKTVANDGSISISLTSFIHSARATSSSSCTLGSITTREKYTEKGMSKKYHNKVWNDIKTTCESYSNNMFNSVKERL